MDVYFQLPKTAEARRIRSVAHSVGTGIELYKSMNEVWDLQRKKIEIIKNIADGIWRGKKDNPIVLWIQEKSFNSIIHLNDKDPEFFSALINLYSSTGERPLTLAKKVRAPAAFLSLVVKYGATE